MDNHKNKMTLLQLTVLTAVSMMGSGIIMLPAKLGQLGSISILSWLVTAVGAMCLAYAFGQCGMYSQKKGGMGGYAEYVFGKSGNFIANFTYGISVVIADAAMALAAAGYGASLLGINLTPWEMAMGTILILWITTILNFRGPAGTGRISSITIWGVILPCLFLSTAGWIWFSPALYMANWNVHNLSLYEAVSQAITMTLWAFLGLETACANSDAVENPNKTVPKAILGGVLLAAACYIVTTNVMFGIVPAQELANSEASFGYVYSVLLGGTAGKVVVAMVLINDFGSLIGWQFTVGNVFKAAADAKEFPRIFGWVNSYSAPVAGMIIITLVQSILALMTVSPSLIKQYEILVDLAVVTNVIPYILSMSALDVLMKREAGNSWRYSRGLSVVAMIGAIYSIYACYAAGEQAMTGGAIVIFAGWVIYGRIQNQQYTLLK